MDRTSQISHKKRREEEKRKKKRRESEPARRPRRHLRVAGTALEFSCPPEGAWDSEVPWL